MTTSPEAARPPAAVPRSLRIAGLWLRDLAALAGTALAVLPMVLAAALIAIARPDAYVDGDQAVDELALMRSEHLAQLVGNYSRFGWNHPGPAWFYALDLVYAPLGGHSWAFYVAVLALHAFAALLIVVVMWRFAGPLAAALTSVLALVYFADLTAQLWRMPWPPFAPILPMALLLLLAGWGAVRSTPALVGALIVGSFAVQTHVGTTLTVTAVCAAMIAIRVAWMVFDRRRRLQDSADRGFWPVWTLAGVALLALMWLPVAADEVAGQHNLSHLAHFFLSQSGQHGWKESLSALGALLAVYVGGPTPDLLQQVWLPMPALAWVALLVFGAATAGLGAAGLWLRDRFAISLAVLLAVAVPVVVISIKHVAGPVYPYFLMWTTCLPLVLAIGWAELLAHGAARLEAGAAWPGLTAAGLAVLLLAPAALLTVRLAGGFRSLPSVVVVQYDPSSRAAWNLTRAALAGKPPQTIVVNITEDDRIPLAGGIALQLKKAGWNVEVNQEWNYIFGPDSVATSDARWELVLVDPKEKQKWDALLPDKQPIGATPDTLLYLRPLYPGLSP